MNFFDHKDLGNHLLQLCPKVLKHPVFTMTLRTVLVFNICVVQKHTVLLYVNFSHVIASEDYPEQQKLLRIEQIEDFNMVALVFDVYL